MRERELAIRDEVNVQIQIHFSDQSKKLLTGATIPDGFTKIIEYGKRKEIYYFKNEEPKSGSYRDYQIK